MFLLVAAIILTSTFLGSVDPTGIKVPSCNTLNILTCMESVMSPISSKKNVPPLAISKSPFLSFNAASCNLVFIVPLQRPQSVPESVFYPKWLKPPAVPEMLLQVVPDVAFSLEQ